MPLHHGLWNGSEGWPQSRRKLRSPPPNERNSPSQSQTAEFCLVAIVDDWRLAGAWLPSFRRRRGDLPAGGGKDPASSAFPCRTRIFRVARQPDILSRGYCFFSAHDSLAHGSWIVLLARGIHFFAAPRLLGIVRSFFPERESAVGRSCSGCGAVDDPGSRDRALHHGPVFESAKSGGVRGNLHGGANPGKKICVGVFVAGCFRVYASADVGVSVFVLSVVCGFGQVGHSSERREGNRGCELIVADNTISCAGGVSGLSRSCEAARLSLPPEMGLVRVAGDRCAAGVVLVVRAHRPAEGVANG